MKPQYASMTLTLIYIFLQSINQMLLVDTNKNDNYYQTSTLEKPSAFYSLIVGTTYEYSLNDQFYIWWFLYNTNNNKGLFDNIFCAMDGIDIVALELLLFYFTAK